MQKCIKISLFHLHEAQHVSGDTLPIIRNLKLHWQPLVFHKWKVVGRVGVGRCEAQYVGRVVGGHCEAQYVPHNVHQPHVQEPSTYEKPEAASAVLGS